mgnify:CR=1 FL=1
MKGRCRAIIKKMAQMRIGVFGSHFGSCHEEFVIGLGDCVVGIEGPSKAGPTGTGVKFVLRAKQWFSRNNVDINSSLMIVPILIMKRRLRDILLRALAMIVGQCF